MGQGNLILWNEIKYFIDHELFQLISYNVFDRDWASEIIPSSWLQRASGVKHMIWCRLYCIIELLYPVEFSHLQNVFFFLIFFFF